MSTFIFNSKRVYSRARACASWIHYSKAKSDIVVLIKFRIKVLIHRAINYKTRCIITESNEDIQIYIAGVAKYGPRFFFLLFVLKIKQAVVQRAIVSMKICVVRVAA